MTTLQQAVPSESHFRLIPGFAVPVIVTAIGVLAKKLVAAKPWEREHFYMGSEMTLAAIAAALVNFADLVKPSDATPPKDFRMLVGSNAGAIVLSFFLLLFVLSLHQDWEQKVKERPKLSFFWLICVSNLIGFGLLALVVILVPVS